MKRLTRYVAAATFFVSAVAMSTGVNASARYSCGAGYILNIAQFKKGNDRVVEIQLDNSVMEPAYGTVFDEALFTQDGKVVKVIGLSSGSNDTLYQQMLTTFLSSFLSQTPILVSTNKTSSSYDYPDCTYEKNDPTSLSIQSCSSASDEVCTKE